MAVRQIEQGMDGFYERVKTQINRANQYVGERFVRNARMVDTYKDDTSNLRNSIGYVLTDNGSLIESAFPGGGQGAQQGQAEGRKVARGYDGQTIVAVAGMPYAVYVEAKGYDVITESTKIMAEDHKKLMRDYLKI